MACPEPREVRANELTKVYRDSSSPFFVERKAPLLTSLVVVQINEAACLRKVILYLVRLALLPDAVVLLLPFALASKQSPFRFECIVRLNALSGGAK
jgi:hypothetical protein